MTMLDEVLLRKHLPVCGLGKVLSFHQEVGSTNDVARELAQKGAPHGTLVVAEAQRKGRGRHGRSWITIPGAGLAISILLRLESEFDNLLARIHAISALGLANALDCLKLNAEIKWPNDILLNGKKVAGILVESSWEGDDLEHVVLGIGMNLTPESIPEAHRLDFPATSVEEILQAKVDPYALIVLVLKGLDQYLKTPGQENLIDLWERRLAFLGREVILKRPDGEVRGMFVGLNREGRALVQTTDQGVIAVGVGESHLRLAHEF